MVWHCAELHASLFLTFSSLTSVTLISYPIYVSVVVVLIKCRHVLNSSFFKICISVGIADLTYLGGRLFFHRLVPAIWNNFPVFRSLIESTVFQTVASFTGWGLYYCQVFGIVILTVNRVTSIWTLGDTLWTKKVVFWAVCFQWFCLFPFNLPKLHPCCYFKLNNVTFYSDFVEPKTFIIYWSLSVILEGIILTPLLITMHVVMVVKVIKHKKTVAPIQGQPMPTGQQNDNSLSMEIRFAILGALLCSCYITMAISYITIWVQEGVSVLQGMLTELVQTIFSVANPYLLLALGKRFREVYWQFMTCKPIQ